MQAIGNLARARTSGLTAALRALYKPRGLFALVGLVAVVAVALPGPREALFDEVRATVGAGNGQPANPLEREQRIVTEYIATRYRVSDDDAGRFVSTAYRAGGELKVDPLLILAVMGIESSYNPEAESAKGAKGLMQVIAKYHPEKLADHGGERALLDPEINIQVGAQILREYLRRFGETDTALQMYAGAFDEPTLRYASKVLAERARLEHTVRRSRKEA